MPSPLGGGGVGARCSPLAPPLLALLCFACGNALDSRPDGVVPACPSAILQVGNTSPCPRFATKQSNELADNRIGGVAETQHIGDWVGSTGLKWMRVIIDPSGEWQHLDWGTDAYAIDGRDERVIDDLVSNGVRIMLVLDV